MQLWSTREEALYTIYSSNPVSRLPQLLDDLRYLPAQAGLGMEPLALLPAPPHPLTCTICRGCTLSVGKLPRP